MTKPQFLISAPFSGSGKTTVTFALLRALADSGYNVQPYKCGPDYIDSKFHEVAAGRPGINLDTFMMPESHLREVYNRHTEQADVSIVEGVMGLFDGARKSDGSSAQIARLLNIPVILVVNASATGYSIAPLLYGYKNFDPQVSIRGVIFNHVSSESHYRFLREACEDVDLTPLGYIPTDDAINIPSRHLGLSISDLEQYDHHIAHAASLLKKHVDPERLTELCQTEFTPYCAPAVFTAKTSRNIAVANDEAFNFTYPENLNRLKSFGDIQFFSPLHDRRLPDADLIYLGGGYPELYVDQLSANEAMKDDIYQYCDAGKPLLAECGGMMYLGRSLTNKEGQNYPMTGVFSYSTSMEPMKLTLGYREVRINGDSLKGHEFHYSTCSDNNSDDTIGEVITARGEPAVTKIFRYKQTIASYVHFYWGDPHGFDVLQRLLNLKPETS